MRPPSLQIVVEFGDARRVLELRQALVLDLSDSLAADPEDQPDLRERLRMVAGARNAARAPLARVLKVSESSFEASRSGSSRRRWRPGEDLSHR
jgi:hypothetical protein